MTDARQHTAEGELDKFIPVRKSDLLAALLAQGDLPGGAEREKFERLCQMLAAIYHYEYFELLDRLRGDYYYFSPDVAPHAAVDRDTSERAYADLVQSLDRVLKDANFKELPHAEIHDAHRQRTVLRVEVKTPLRDFREVRVYRRGWHVEQFEVAEWLGLRRRKVEAEVYDDVVLLVAMKSHAEIASRRELRTLERRKIVPGSVLLKYFRNVASSDLYALFPNVRVVMSNFDKLVLGVPALAGGIPILLKLFATVTVLFVVIGFYVGANPTVADKDMKTALAALAGLVALGGFAMRQWLKYQRQSLRYQIELTDNIYFRNINNNAGIFDYVIGAAEDQECKEAFLAYYFALAAKSAPTAAELVERVESWLRQTFGFNAGFAADDAVAKLERFGLLTRQGERLVASPLDGATAQLQQVWARYFARERQSAAHMKAAKPVRPVLRLLP
jgi:uncharacterized protein DUF3754